MAYRSIGLLIFMFTAVSLATLYSDPDSTTEWSVTKSVREARQGAGGELGALLDAGDGAVVTLEGGGARLAAHRAVLAARSPALESTLRHYSGRLRVPGVGGAALRRLLTYLYSRRAPRLPPGAAAQLLAAAHRLGLPADCEPQVAEQLSVETAATAAVLAVKHALADLRQAALNLIKEHFIEVLTTKGWADAVEDQPREVVKVTLLLAGRMAENCAPGTMEAETTASNEAGTTTTTEAGTTASTQPRSGAGQTPATAAPPLAACPTAPLDEATVSRLRSLSGEDRDSRLIQAAGEGEVGELRALLAAGADVVARDEDGETGLHWAARWGRVEAASCLLAAGAQVGARDRGQATPLHWAAYWGRAAVARLLLAASADPNARNDRGSTPLHAAAGDGSAEVVAALLAASADPNARDERGNTPLHWAAGDGSAEVAAALLEAGADRGARNADGRTPLDYARSFNHQHLFEMLAQR